MQNINTFWLTQWGGIVQNKHDSLIPVGYFYDAVNYCIEKDGTLRPRNGVKPVYGNVDGEPIKFFSARLKGKPYIFLATTTSVYVYGNGFEKIHEWETEAEKASFAVINANTSPVVVIGNGKDRMVCYKCREFGISLATYPLEEENAPKGLPVDYMNYIAVYGIDEHPDKVVFTAKSGQYCNEEDGDDIWLHGGIPLGLEIDGEVTALVSFGGALIIFTEHQTFLFRGDPEEPQGLIKLSDNIGCVNNNSFCIAENQLYFISRRGICYYNGEGRFPTEIISDASPERPSNITEDFYKASFLKRGSDGVAGGLLQTSCCYDYINRRILFCIEHYKKQFEAELTQSVFVFELKNLSWYRWNFKNIGSIKTLCFVACILSRRIDNEENIFLATSNGIYRLSAEHNSENYIDITSDSQSKDIEYSLKSGAMDMGSTDSDKIFRALTLKVIPNFNGYEGFKELDVYGYGDFQPTYQKANFHASFSFIMGVSSMGDRLQMDYPTEQRRPMAIKSKYFAFEIIGKGDKNSLPICGIGIGFRGYSRRSTMTWENDLI